MKTMNFETFARGDYTEHGESLYIVSFESIVFYVGISKDNIYNRWFGGRSHLYRAGETWRGMSNIGKRIAACMPESNKYKIQLLTVADCKVFLGQEVNRIDLLTLEDMMIEKLKPSDNVRHNPYHDPTFFNTLRRSQVNLGTTISDFIPFEG